jgi:hypothetical protein
MTLGIFARIAQIGPRRIMTPERKSRQRVKSATSASPSAQTGTATEARKHEH